MTNKKFTDDWEMASDEVIRRAASYQAALLAIVQKGDEAGSDRDCCGDCYEMECDSDCPVRIARAALKMPQRNER